jgi:hypothetical protein
MRVNFLLIRGNGPPIDRAPARIIRRAASGPRRWRIMSPELALG